MRSLLFFVLNFILLNSETNARYETWGATNTNEQIKINAELIQIIEQATKPPFKKISDVTILSKKYKLVLKENQDYQSLKKYYNPEPPLTGSIQLKSLLTSSKLHLTKTTNDPSVLKNMNYRLSVPEELGCSFWVIPLSTYSRLSKSTLASVLRPKGIKSKLPVVTDFASCRVQFPLMEMFKAGKVSFNNGVLPRNHFTAAEAVQMMKFAQGTLALPEAKFRELFWCRPEMRDFELMKYSETDIFIVESCMLEQFELDGYFLHYNRVMQMLFRKPYSDGVKTTYPLMPYYKILLTQAEKAAGVSDLYRKSPSEFGNLSDIMKKIPPRFLTEDELYVLEHIKMSMLNEESYIQHMKDFSKLANGKPVIFVPHINVKDPENNTLFYRELMDRYVQKGAKLTKQHYFRPADFIMREYGQDLALASIDDFSHYKDEFNSVIGEVILQKVYKVIN